MDSEVAPHELFVGEENVPFARTGFWVSENTVSVVTLESLPYSSWIEAENMSEGVSFMIERAKNEANRSL